MHVLLLLLTAFVSLILSLLLTVPLDSILWGRLLWPELEVFHFNAVLNKSSDYGTLPFLWYFYSALPRALLLSYPLSVVGAVVEKEVRGLFVVATFYVTAYSFLPHKELRFLLPVLPLYTACAAAGALRVWRDRRRSVLSFLCWLGLLFGGGGASILCVALFATASAWNYPGGHALQALQHLHTLGISKELAFPSVHVDNLAAMTGVTRFLELPSPPWRHSKEEGLRVEELTGRNFTYLLSERAEVEGYVCAAAAFGYAGFNVQSGSFPPSVSLKLEERVFIHVREPDKVEAVLNHPRLFQDLPFVTSCGSNVLDSNKSDEDANEAAVGHNEL